MTGERGWQRLLLPERLLTWPVFASSLVWMMLLHFVDVENNAGYGAWAERAALLVFVHAVAFAFPAVTYLLLRRVVIADVLMILLFLSIAMGSTVRGWLLSEGLEVLTNTTRDDLALRIGASLTNVTVAVTLVWVGVSSAELHRRRRERLLEDRDQLLLLRQQARAQLDQLDERAAEEIRASLLRDLESSPTNQPEGVLASLRHLINEVVRPLSRHFEAQSLEWIPPEPQRHILTINWRDVVRQGLDPRQIKPLLMMGVLVWVSLSNTFFHRGWVIALISTVHLLVIGTLVVRWAARFFDKATADATRNSRVAGFFLALFISGMVIGLMSVLYTRFQEPRFYYATVSPAFTLICGTLIAFASVAMEQSREMEAAIARSADQLRWSLARAREMHRQQRRALAHALHGQVQAALASGILRLELSQSSDPGNQQVAGEIVDTLKSVIGAVDFLQITHDRLAVVEERIKSTWDGVAKIEFDVQPEVIARLERDRVCAVAVNDVLTELTFNSIKHGAATEIAVVMTMIAAEVMRISVKDNGEVALLPGRPGMGTALLEDCAISWRRVRSDGRTETRVLLPIEM